ncbi:hypothetical protein STRCI_008651 [Streptomyces cinnabarinus]|uniref:Uncharacterized protein n=1 Tax=Streptomyces cinnabarinus TaxID=67287 RepID=A0ABY7KTL6_9ACTN|nr:hypothetical protein [Streptomyces cinnabarinus]WAZ26960.1 hypothetical protein STRCI_008651 [Streptomyces cinnabarinus]
MGDLDSHAHCSVYTAGQLDAALPSGWLPSAFSTYLEVGNFLTDLSQFRDPFGYLLGRQTAEREVGRVTKQVADFDLWVDNMFGELKPGSYGWLGEFFTRFAAAATYVSFADNSDYLLVDELPPLPPRDVKLAFDWAFTLHTPQYYPHLHLDLPPFRSASHHRNSLIYRTGTRSVLRYLEEDIAYLSEELSKLEAAWAGDIRRNKPDPHRFHLVRLGSLLHAVEDYYFHSNFPELWHWQRQRVQHPELQPDQQPDYDALILHSLVASLTPGTRPSPQSRHRLARRLKRRLRYPVYERGTLGSRTSSEPGNTFAYTGGFGKDDIYHTLGGFLEFLERRFTAEGLTILTNSDLILVRLLFNSQARRDTYQQDQSRKHLKTHLQQLQDDLYLNLINVLEEIHVVPPQAAAELREAFALDRQVDESFSSVLEEISEKSFSLPGPGGVLINLLAQMQRERDRSAQQAARLNQMETPKLDRATGNGASQENIGSHSLMAKDTPGSAPMYGEAAALAKHASASIATTLLQRLASNPDLLTGIDWTLVLRHYLRFPRVVPSAWESTVLHRFATNPAGFTQPPLTDIADRPPPALLQGAPLRARRDGRTRLELERRYDAMST